MSKNVKTDHTHIITSSVNGCRLALVADQDAVSLNLARLSGWVNINVYEGDALHAFNAAVRAYVEHLDRTERAMTGGASILPYVSGLKAALLPPNTIFGTPCQTPPENTSNGKS